MSWQSDWAYNKYWVMAHSQNAYNEIRTLAKNNHWDEKKEQEYQQIVQSLENVEPTKATLVTAYQHIWGYFKKIATSEEKQQYLKLLDYLSPENDNLGAFLTQLTDKYQVKYLQNSRIIIEIKEQNK
ncbi:YbgA family protein [Apilactobacillus micheneri]|uniref:YbgA family protein n=1 Tax=Apilactobacillus micheneri TaxID=1899430 RepID=UPI001CDD3C7B|nr:YbgA family protein [Apilactobacillus micheneri]